MNSEISHAHVVAFNIYYATLFCCCCTSFHHLMRLHNVDWLDLFLKLVNMLNMYLRSKPNLNIIIWAGKSSNLELISLVAIALSLFWRYDGIDGRMATILIHFGWKKANLNHIYTLETNKSTKMYWRMNFRIACESEQKAFGQAAKRNEKKLHILYEIA